MVLNRRCIRQAQIRGAAAAPPIVRQAKESRTFSVSRPMLVVVLNCWVIETNETPRVAAPTRPTNFGRGAHVHREMWLNMIDKFWYSGREWIGLICPLLAFRAII
jgi:hypothetical protein